jgi:3-oxoacyl-[acyl-carrier protein] reductase
MKHIVVTGASRGLGLEITRTLLADGYHVSAIARRRTHELTQLETLNVGRLKFIAADLGDSSRITTLVAQVREICPLPVWGLVNNAAVANDTLLVLQQRSQIEEMLSVNIAAPIHLSRLFAKRMMIEGAGCIINISSVLANRSGRGAVVYATTKAALEGFTRAFAVEVGAKGIRVNAVAPGYLRTAMSNDLALDEQARIVRRSALRRVASLTEVAEAVRFFLSPAAEAITGQVLPVDCGASVY